MAQRRQDGGAGDADYGALGSTYSRYRRPDPRIAAVITQALGEARTVLNVGSGAGSYEPTDREVTAVEPSAVMRAQRPAHLAPAVDATAEQAALRRRLLRRRHDHLQRPPVAGPSCGPGRARRVTRGPVVILTCDPARVQEFWVREYAPEVLEVEARRCPSPEALADGLGGGVSISTVLIPQGRTDGFTEAYYGRPEHLLDVEARRAPARPGRSSTPR
ncbi:SAM-dependent methyltransferase [Brachybacterium sp. GPGPB12]|uniref:SAM-dependent methyltransferase n=1 Tax=Brachybacterium sp. GPGPB12 TaxID=3023517 RepID=UPI003134490B